MFGDKCAPASTKILEAYLNTAISQAFAGTVVALLGSLVPMFNLQRKPNLSEVVYRLRDLPWVGSHVLRQVTETYHLVSPSEFSQLYRQVRPLTMCSAARLRGLYDAINHVVSRDVPGDIVECGVARGGSAALMGLALKQRAEARQLWLFDTFEGLPAPTPDDPDFDIARNYIGTCKGTIEDVMGSFERLELKASPVKGMFQNTLPTTEISEIAVLHIDGDWYESTKTVLNHLYDRVSVGGVIQLDDYGYWKGSAKAVQEFFAERDMDPQLKQLDYSGRQFIKQ